MKRKIIIIAAAILIAVTLRWLYTASHRSVAPSGQPPLVRLNHSNVDALKAGFNQSKNSIRVLLLLSPT